MSSKHTPGPFAAYITPECLMYVMLDDGAPVGPDGNKLVAEINTGNPADAHLIAAAPDLLEALEMADATLRGANMNRAVVERTVRAAIAKARGEVE